MKRVRAHLTYGNAIASLALFVALGGGAYAAATVGPEDIENGAVRSNHIANYAVTENKVADLAFQKLVLMNGWQVQDSRRPPAFAVDAQGVVHLRGAMENPTCDDLLGTPFFVPAEIRPSSLVRVPAAVDSGIASVFVAPNGQASIGCGEPGDTHACGETSLEGVTYTLP